MIQQGGYGQIYGSMGGASVGASIYSAARENVTFARMVELQKLNLAKRQLRMQQAQAAANADLSRRRLDMESTRLELEARRLDMVDKQNEEQRIRANQAYEAKVRELEQREQERQSSLELSKERIGLEDARIKLEGRRLDMQDRHYEEQQRQADIEAEIKREALRQKEAESRASAERQAQLDNLKLEQQNFENVRNLSKDGGVMMDKDGKVVDSGGNYVKLPGSSAVIRFPVGKSEAVRSKDDQAYKRVLAVVENDLKAENTRIAEARKRVEKMEQELERKQRDADFGSKAAKEGLESYRAEVEAARVSVGHNASYEALERYRDAVAGDTSLIGIAPYAKWKTLPWKEYDSEQTGLLYGLLAGGSPDEKALLGVLVDAKDFNPYVAGAWLSAKEKLGEGLKETPAQWLNKYPYIYNKDIKENEWEYLDALTRDGTLLMDVDYGKWREMPWDTMGDDEKSFLNMLVGSGASSDRGILSAIVDADDRGFDLKTATEYRNAAVNDGTVARMIGAKRWLGVDWAGVEPQVTWWLCSLLGSTKGEDLKIVNEWLSRHGRSKSDAGKKADGGNDK